MPEGARTTQTTVREAWLKELKHRSYTHHIIDFKFKLSRVWKKIFNNIKLNDFQKLSVLEVGCGGGIQLAGLAAMGCKCTGIDVSMEVLERANNYFNEIRNTYKLKLDIHLIHGDFMELQSKETGDNYDMVFNFGVIEHYINDVLRISFLKKKYDLVKKGGYIISVVPNGAHPLRYKARQNGLGGYHIPEIDYNQHLMEEEFKLIGGREINILPHDLFGYITMEKTNILNDTVKKLFYYGFQAIPLDLLPANFGYKHVSSLIGIARKN